LESAETQAQVEERIECILVSTKRSLTSTHVLPSLASSNLSLLVRWLTSMKVLPILGQLEPITACALVDLSKGFGVLAVFVSVQILRRD